MRAVLRYALPLFPVVALAGILHGGESTYAGALLLIIACVGTDALLRLQGVGTRADLGEIEEAWRDETPLLLYLAAQIAVMAFAVVWVPSQRFTLFEWVGSLLSLALITGTLGTLIAHEYVHRSRRWERLLGTVAFGAVNYAHFRLSHVFGHHAKVGLREDWSTARRGETSYAFLVRAIAMGWWGAWRIEARRLSRRGKGPISFENAMLVGTLLQGSLMVGIGAFLGMKPLGFFLATSLVSVSITELVNYLGHYGLVREPGAPIAAAHSWETDHRLTNWLLLEAGKHCDHHLQPARHHSGLKLQHPRAIVPFGVPALLLMSLIPPVFFGIMHRYLGPPEMTLPLAAERIRVL